MTCHAAREQLSALLDDALSAPERQALDAHLAGCADCRRELAHLRGTVALLERLPPVHAPAGFVDRVLAAAEHPSWPRRVLDAVFRPLRVKLPLEAAAVLLVGVSALYVYQHAPEVQQAARRETVEPPSVPGPAPVAPPAPPAAGSAPHEPDIARQAKQAPAEQEMPRWKAAAPPAVTPPAPDAPAAPPVGTGGAAQGTTAAAKPAATPELRAAAKPDTKKEAPAEERADAARAMPSSGSSSAPSSEKVDKVAQSAEPSPSRDASGPRAAAAPPPTAAVPPSGEPAAAADARSRMGAPGAAPPAARANEGAAGDALATAKSRSSARLMRAVDASGRLAVPAREPAEIALDALLSRLDATRVARRLEGRLVLIDVVVAGPRYHELLEGLGRIGRWTTEHEPKALPPEVRVEVAISVEP